MSDPYLMDTEYLAEMFRDYITKHYGERCPDKEKDCACCDMWALYDKFAEYTLDENEE